MCRLLFCFRLGNICGVDSAVKDLPYKWQPNFLGGNPSTTGQLVPALFAVCSIGCPRKGAQVQDPYEVYGSWEAQVDSMIFLKTCLYRAQERDSTSAVTIISDFVQAAVLIALLGFFSAVLVSLLYLFLTTLPLVLRGLVWFCATLVFALLCSGAYFFLDGARQEQHRSDGNLQSHTEVIIVRAFNLSNFIFFYYAIDCFDEFRGVCTGNINSDMGICYFFYAR